MQQRANSNKEYASAKRKKDILENERSEYQKKSMKLKEKQTNALEQKNAIEFCKLLKDCGEYHKEEFDALVKSTFESIMKSHEDSTVIDSSSNRAGSSARDCPDVVTASINTMSSTLRRSNHGSTSDLSIQVESSATSGSSNDISPSSSSRERNNNASAMESHDNSPAFSRTSIDSTVRLATQMSQQRRSSVFLDDESTSEHESEDDENNFSSSSRNVLTQARAHE